LFERARLMQINIKANEIYFLGSQELSRRKGAERAKTVRIDGLGFVHQFIDKARYPGGAAPANDLRRNLVDHAQSEHCRMVLASLGRLAHGPACLLLDLVTLEEAEVLGPGHIDEELQSLLGCQIQKPAGRNVIYTEEV